MRQRREVTGCSHRTLRGDLRQHTGLIQQIEQSLDDDGPDAGIAAGQTGNL